MSRIAVLVAFAVVTLHALGFVTKAHTAKSAGASARAHRLAHRLTTDKNAVSTSADTAEPAPRRRIAFDVEWRIPVGCDFSGFFVEVVLGYIPYLYERTPTFLLQNPCSDEFLTQKLSPHDAVVYRATQVRDNERTAPQTSRSVAIEHAEPCKIRDFVDGGRPLLLISRSMSEGHLAAQQARCLRDKDVDEVGWWCSFVRLCVRRALFDRLLSIHYANHGACRCGSPQSSMWLRSRTLACLSTSFAWFPKVSMLTSSIHSNFCDRHLSCRQRVSFLTMSWQTTLCALRPPVRSSDAWAWKMRAHCLR